MIDFQAMALAAVAVTVIMLPIALIMRSSKKQQLGMVRCRRCGHVGSIAWKWVPFVGTTPVCANCSSEDWRSA